MFHGIDSDSQPKRAANSSATTSDEYNSAQDHLLPIANVGRIMKQALPSNAKISKEAKETMQECASEFIAFIISEASQRCRMEGRKTIHGDDICSAMKALGLDEYAKATAKYLHKYREHGDLLASSKKQENPLQIDITEELTSYGNPNPHNSKGIARTRRFL